VSIRLDCTDSAAKAAEERLPLIINELNDEVEQVCYSTEIPPHEYLIWPDNTQLHPLPPIHHSPADGVECIPLDFVCVPPDKVFRCEDSAKVLECAHPTKV
jgi:hypothetical protein